MTDTARGLSEAARAAKTLRAWSNAYRTGPVENRFPSDPTAEFFPVDLDNAADIIGHLSSSGGAGSRANLSERLLSEHAVALGDGATPTYWNCDDDAADAVIPIPVKLRDDLVSFLLASPPPVAAPVDRDAVLEHIRKECGAVRIDGFDGVEIFMMDFIDDALKGNPSEPSAAVKALVPSTEEIMAAWSAFHEAHGSAGMAMHTYSSVHRAGYCAGYTAALASPPKSQS